MDMSGKRMVKAKSILSTIGSVAAAAMVTRTIINDFLPPEIHDCLSSTLRSWISHRSSEFTLIINELNGYKTNQIFEAAELYLGTLTTTSSLSSSSTTHRLCVTKFESEKSIDVAVDQDQETVDEFEGVKFSWVLHCEQRSEMYKHSTIRAFHLSFHKRYKQLALDKYLSYVLDQADLFKQENKAIKLFTIQYASDGTWDSVNLNHPSKFDTLAMDPDMKNTIMDDLDRFLGRKEYYRQVGKAWKRGYLLYGPPGTGKSSLIAAMANYLNFDIYDLDLSELSSDSDLRKLLIGTGNRSIIVVEDIDCTIEFKDRDAKDNVNNEDGNARSHVTLSGFLNFIDGLWSSCGDARIIIFTTNHKDKLDPALLRPGRMDMHIHMSYCTPSGFRVLARNYLGVKNHDKFEEIEGLIVEGRVTPADVAEQLIKHDQPSAALGGLVDFLRAKTKRDALVVADGANGGTVNEPLRNVREVENVGQSVKKLGEENASVV